MRTIYIEPTEDNLIDLLVKDKIKRNKDLKRFYDLIMALENNFTIAIDGRWGSGKTFFVKQLELIINALNPMCQMEEGKKNLIANSIIKKEMEENYDLAVYFDAWENDNDTDPILSLIYEIVKQLNMDYSFKNTDIIMLGATIIEGISRKGVSNILDKLRGENLCEEFDKQKDLSDKIKTFFEEVRNERGNHLVIFVDELDRCKPSFAVRLLEQIKHYFSIDGLIFVFSINSIELQHTIKHYYGNEFDACRYLDRFFDLRISLPTADLTGVYQEMGIGSAYAVDKVSMKVAEMLGMELREISRFYSQVKNSVYKPTHSYDDRDFAFPEEKAKRFMMICVVPLVIGLRIVNVSLLDEFIKGENAGPLLKLLEDASLCDWILGVYLGMAESLNQVNDEKLKTRENLIKQVYCAIFANKYEGRKHEERIGDCDFDAHSKGFVLNASSMLTNYADFGI